MSIHHSFDIDLAAHLKSVDLAILVHHFQHWIKVNIKLKRNYIDGRTWTYQTREEIAAHFPYWSTHQVRRLTDKLVKLKILRKGNFNKKSVDKTIWYCFEDSNYVYDWQNCQSSGKSANGAGEIAKPIPHSKPHSLPTYVKDLGLATEASYKSEVKNLDVSKRWKLTDYQMEAFEWLKEKGIDAEDPKLAYWAKTYPLQRLIDVFNEATHNGARSLRKYMGKLLDEEKIVHNSRIQANAEFAKDFAAINNWTELKIFKRYIKFPLGSSSVDLSLDMDSNTFIFTLMNKFDSIQRQP